MEDLWWLPVTLALLGSILQAMERRSIVKDVREKVEEIRLYQLTAEEQSHDKAHDQLDGVIRRLDRLERD